MITRDPPGPNDLVLTAKIVKKLKLKLSLDTIGRRAKVGYVVNKNMQSLLKVRILCKDAMLRILRHYPKTERVFIYLVERGGHFFWANPKPMKVAKFKDKKGRTCINCPIEVSFVHVPRRPCKAHTKCIFRFYNPDHGTSNNCKLIGHTLI